MVIVVKSDKLLDKALAKIGAILAAPLIALCEWKIGVDSKRGVDSSLLNVLVDDGLESPNLKGAIGRRRRCGLIILS